MTDPKWVLEVRKEIKRLNNKIRRLEAKQEADEAKQLGLNYINSPISPLSTPKDLQVNDLVAKLQSSTLFPIFIHCQHGQDRTGLIIGLIAYVGHNYLSTQIDKTANKMEVASAVSAAGRGNYPRAGAIGRRDRRKLRAGHDREARPGMG